MFFYLAMEGLTLPFKVFFLHAELYFSAKNLEPSKSFIKIKKCILKSDSMFVFSQHK